MKKIEFFLLGVLALTVTSCGAPTYESRMEFIVEPTVQATQQTGAKPKQAAVPPTPTTVMQRNRN